MLFVLNCTDKPDSLELRVATRPAHLEYLAKFAEKLLLAGPVMAGGKPVGSMIVFQAETLAAVREFAANDPYTLAGLFANVRLRPFRAVYRNGRLNPAVAKAEAAEKTEAAGNA